MKEYPDISRAKISLTASLSQRKFRKKENLFVVEGRKSVQDTLPHYELEFMVGLSDWIYDHPALCEPHKDRVYIADEGEMRKMSSLSTAPDVIAVYHLPATTDSDQLLSTPLPDDLYLMLDSIQDPGNLGTIIRTAHWFGISRIFASPMTADIYNPKTIQSSMGSLPFVRVDYIDLSLMAGKNPTLPVIGLQLEGYDIYTTPLPQKGFIVMGNEGNGLSPSMKGELTLGLTIPPYDPDCHPESLNVAVATAITISQFRSRQPK